MAQSTDTRITQQGSNFQRSTDGSSYSDLTDLKEIEAPPFKREASDDTVLTATSETSTPAYIDSIAQAKVTVFMTETQFTTLRGDIVNKTTPLYWKHKYLASGTETTGPIISYQGWVKSLESGKATAKSTDKLMVTMEIERTTTPAYTAGA